MDYKKIGFKAGLEIHQQLDTNKLFCDCPSVLRSDEPNFKIKRKLHAVAGESGKVDVAAKYQSEMNQDFVYEGYDTTCLVELDEEPPHEINKEALEIALEISLLLNCKIVPVAQIMRKTVINGSNTSGFQRTVMVARDGFIETSLGKVGIDSVYLEEDSARPVGKNFEETVFRLDRLGIPLIEISTRPDLKDAEHVKEVALKLGEVLRSSRVRRGIGTIRQDVNISIKGSNRVEIKGFQDPKIMEKCVELEVKRQQNILEKEKENLSEVRNCLNDGKTEFLRPMPGSSRMYPETDLELLHVSKSLINKVKKNLPKLRSEIEEDLRKQGLNEEMIKLLFKRGKVNEFLELYKSYGNPNLIAKMLLIFIVDIAVKENKEIKEVEEILDFGVLGIILEKVNSNKLHPANVKPVLEKIISGIDVKDAVKIDKQDLDKIEEEIMKIVKGKPGLNANAYMGLVMKEFREQVSGQEAMKIIKKYLN